MIFDHYGEFKFQPVKNRRSLNVRPLNPGVTVKREKYIRGHNFGIGFANSLTNTGGCSRSLRRIFGTERETVRTSGKKYIMRGEI
jgi:hypothetical protein